MATSKSAVAATDGTDPPATRHTRRACTARAARTVPIESRRSSPAGVTSMQNLQTPETGPHEVTHRELRAVPRHVAVLAGPLGALLDERAPELLVLLAVPDREHLLLEQIADDGLVLEIAAAGDDVAVRGDHERHPRIRAEVVAFGRGLGELLHVAGRVVEHARRDVDPRRIEHRT